MASKKHPLDVFRSSGSGFDSATQRRRKLAGKVTVKSMHGRNERSKRAAAASKTRAPSSGASGSSGSGRAASRTPASRASASKASAGRSADAAGSKTRASAPVGVRARRAAMSLNTMLLIAAVLLAGGMTAVVVWSSGGEGDPITLSQSRPVFEVEGGSEPAVPAVPERFTIRAATYPGDANGLDLAKAAGAELKARGFSDVLVYGAFEDGTTIVRNYQILVGETNTRAALGEELERLRSISDWKFGARAPFKDALVTGHPEPQRR